MTDPKHQRPLPPAMTQWPGITETRSASPARKRRPEDGTPGPEDLIGDLGDLGDSDTDAVDAGASAGGSAIPGPGSSATGLDAAAYVGVGALGLAGFAAALSSRSGGGSMSSIQQPVPGDPQRPQPEAPKPQVPTPEAPPPGQSGTGQAQPEQPSPEQPSPGQPHPGQPQPEQPGPEHPQPEKPEPVEPTPPAAPGARLADDTGAGDDLVTRDGRVAVQVEPGHAWQYSLDGGATWIDGVGDHIDAAVFGADGDKVVLVAQLNATQQRGETATLQFTLDTSIAPVQLDLKNDTGVAGDRITADGVISVTGLEAGATWTYSTDGGKTWRPGVDAEIPSDQFDGKHEVLVIQTDKAGNTSVASTLSFAQDTGAPTLALKNDTARSLYDDALGAYVTDERHKHDGITRDATVTVSGLQGGATWLYSLDEGQSWKQGAGTEIAASEFGADGQKSVWTKQMTTTTTTESGISAFSFVLDTHVATITPRLKSIDSMEGELPAAAKPIVVFDGYEEGASIVFSIFGAGTSRGETVMGVGELALDLQPGRVQITEIIQTDIAGNASDYGASGRLEFTVLSQSPAPTMSLSSPGGSPLDV